MQETQPIAITSAPPPVYCADPTLDLKTQATSDLFILLYPNHAQLALKERKTNRFTGLETVAFAGEHSWDDKIDSLFNSSRLLTFTYSRVHVAIAGTQYTLIPDALFKTGDEARYHSLNFIPGPGRILKPAKCPSFQLHVVFSIDPAMKAAIDRRFTDAVIHPHAQSLLESLPISNAGKSGRQVRVNLGYGLLDIMAWENRSLIMLNSFSYQTLEDALYYFLFVCEQLELSPGTSTIQYTGEIEAGDEHFQLIDSYIQQTELMKRPASAAFSLAFNAIAPYRFHTLFTLPLCES